MKTFGEEIELKRQAALDRLSKVPIAILLWGPSEDKNTEIAQLRVNLKKTLKDLGHEVYFSEELYNDKSPYSLRIQQFIQVEVFDLVISIPETEGSIAEIHDFARMPTFSNKVIVFLDTGWSNGYSNKTLIEAQTRLSSKVILYTKESMPACIVDQCIKEVIALQEYYYMFGRGVNV
ncbi:MAG TPA: hypothetical protein EYG73_03120 [Arcobacter sp.]|nr:hypothetical protein [Arcobacter sp.]